ncbi:MAG: hypothetical protein WHW07_00770 [Bacteroidales bacterium]|nr:hypothetical protein [Bacteroidales bacterium]HOL98686.1 hypothetical protein [Bacteroidales bacterium]HOM37133.1 hypothetical protein [Bacteroidales bacterium]HPD24785.1 hypothetical protein [Bacteroidales bacterium]HRT00531.1 hypothetical protein [Bacteroidales bacterium]
MKKFYKYFIILIIILNSWNLFAQSNTHFRLVELTNLAGTYNNHNNKIKVDGEEYFYFNFTYPTEEFLIKIYPAQKYSDKEFVFYSSADYEFTDSVYYIQDHYETKIKFKNIIDNPKLSFKYSISEQNSKSNVFEIILLPVAVMDCGFVKTPEELFTGEEFLVEIYSSLPENIVINLSWNKEFPVHYRMIKSKTDEIIINFLATQPGQYSIPIYLELKKPMMDENGNLIYKYGPLKLDINVKTSRLAFLSTDIKEISIDEKNRSEGVEIQIDYNRNLQLQKTYRIENSEAPGGVLIAELFTKSRLANNKVLAVVRTYNYHNQTDGLMYIKDGDEPKFITNFSIIPLTKIQSVRIMRDGSNWLNSTSLYPGEEVLIRFEGQSLLRSKISVEDLQIIKSDTLLSSNEVIEFRALVPFDIKKRNLNVLVNNQPTGLMFHIVEYERIRAFDYITIDYGAGPKELLSYTGPAFTPKTIKDIVISFDVNKIDSNNELYGNQYLDIEVKITGSRGEVLEVLNLNSVLVSPGSLSPRYQFYNRKNSNTVILLNQYLNRKTFDLDSWVRIQITFKPSKATSLSRSDIKTVDIIVQKSARFDIDVSFPAGLITKKIGDPGYGDLGGISLAMIAQFSFYQKEKINRFRPYKIGAGFIAINALNFADNNALRDMGVVIIGSLYPTTKESKMTFPLYLGGGYLLSSDKWFVLLGPGIRVRL